MHDADVDQLDLGDLIHALDGADPSAAVVIDDGAAVPGQFDSYRGYYDHLALDPSPGQPPRVEEFLADARAAHGATFTGYKGGEYHMGRHTPVWVAAHGVCSSRRLVAVETTPDVVVLRTDTVDDGW